MSAILDSGTHNVIQFNCTWQAKQCLEATAEIIIVTACGMKDNISQVTPQRSLLLRI